jgi:hypothetical protein
MLLAVTAIALIAGIQTPGAQGSTASVTVSLLNVPGMTEGDDSCNDGVADLKRIIGPGTGGFEHTLNPDATSLTGSEEQGAQQIRASQFFLEPDIEDASALNRSSTAQFSSGAGIAFRKWLHAYEDLSARRAPS